MELPENAPERKTIYYLLYLLIYRVHPVLGQLLVPPARWDPLAIVKRSTKHPLTSLTIPKFNPPSLDHSPEAPFLLLSRLAWPIENW
jgi:hypothetical protein